MPESGLLKRKADMDRNTEVGAKRKRSRGQSMAEYALIIALVAIAVIGAVSFLGGRIGDVFTRAGEELQEAVDE